MAFWHTDPVVPQRETSPTQPRETSPTHTLQLDGSTRSHSHSHTAADRGESSTVFPTAATGPFQSGIGDSSALQHASAVPFQSGAGDSAALPHVHGPFQSGLGDSTALPTSAAAPFQSGASSRSLQPNNPQPLQFRSQHTTFLRRPSAEVLTNINSRWWDDADPPPPKVLTMPWLRQKRQIVGSLLHSFPAQLTITIFILIDLYLTASELFSEKDRECTALCQVVICGLAMEVCIRMFVEGAAFFLKWLNVLESTVIILGIIVVWAGPVFPAGAVRVVRPAARVFRGLRVALRLWLGGGRMKKSAAQAVSDRTKKLIEKAFRDFVCVRTDNMLMNPLTGSVHMTKARINSRTFEGLFSPVTIIGGLVEEIYADVPVQKVITSRFGKESGLKSFGNFLTLMRWWPLKGKSDEESRNVLKVQVRNMIIVLGPSDPVEWKDDEEVMRRKADIIDLVIDHMMPRTMPLKRVMKVLGIDANKQARAVATGHFMERLRMKVLEKMRELKGWVLDQVKQKLLVEIDIHVANIVLQYEDPRGTCGQSVVVGCKLGSMRVTTSAAAAGWRRHQEVRLWGDTDEVDDFMPATEDAENDLSPQGCGSTSSPTTLPRSSVAYSGFGLLSSTVTSTTTSAKALFLRGDSTIGSPYRRPRLRSLCSDEESMASVTSKSALVLDYAAVFVERVSTFVTVNPGRHAYYTDLFSRNPPAPEAALRQLRYTDLLERMRLAYAGLRVRAARAGASEPYGGKGERIPELMQQYQYAAFPLQLAIRLPLPRAPDHVIKWASRVLDVKTSALSLAFDTNQTSSLYRILHDIRRWLKCARKVHLRPEVRISSIISGRLSQLTHDRRHRRMVIRQWWIYAFVCVQEQSQAHSRRRARDVEFQLLSSRRQEYMGLVMEALRLGYRRVEASQLSYTTCRLKEVQMRMPMRDVMVVHIEARLALVKEKVKQEEDREKAVAAHQSHHLGSFGLVDRFAKNSADLSTMSWKSVTGFLTGVVSSAATTTGSTTKDDVSEATESYDDESEEPDEDYEPLISFAEIEHSVPKSLHLTLPLIELSVLQVMDWEVPGSAVSIRPPKYCRCGTRHRIFRAWVYGIRSGMSIGRSSEEEAEQGLPHIAPERFQVSIAHAGASYCDPRTGVEREALRCQRFTSSSSNNNHASRKYFLVLTCTKSDLAKIDDWSETTPKTLMKGPSGSMGRETWKGLDQENCWKGILHVGRLDVVLDMMPIMRLANAVDPVLADSLAEVLIHWLLADQTWKWKGLQAWLPGQARADRDNRAPEAPRLTQDAERKFLRERSRHINIRLCELLLGYKFPIQVDFLLELVSHGARFRILSPEWCAGQWSSWFSSQALQGGAPACRIPDPGARHVEVSWFIPPGRSYLKRQQEPPAVSLEQQAFSYGLLEEAVQRRQDHGLASPVWPGRSASSSTWVEESANRGLLHLPSFIADPPWVPMHEMSWSSGVLVPTLPLPTYDERTVNTLLPKGYRLNL